MSTALSPTGSSTLPPRYTEETRLVAQNTTSPPPAPSVATHSSPSKAGRRLQTSTFAFSTKLLLAMQSRVTPKSKVTPTQSHPRGLPARASIGRGEKQAHTPHHQLGKSRCCYMQLMLYRSRGWGRERGLCLKVWHNLTYPWHQREAEAFLFLPFIPSAWKLHLLNNMLAG